MKTLGIKNVSVPQKILLQIVLKLTPVAQVRTSESFQSFRLTNTADQHSQAVRDLGKEGTHQQHKVVDLKIS